jgi:hypothetical protein
VACFAGLKRAYSEIIDQHARVRINHIDKLDFLTTYPRAREKAVNQASTIQSGFRSTGLMPFNPTKALSKLNIRLKTPTPPPSRGSYYSSDFVPATPQNLIQLQKQASSIKALLKKRSQSPPTPTNKAINQLIKGCELAMQGAVLLARENQDLRTANAKQRQKRTRSTRQLVHEGGLSVEEARTLIQRRETLVETEAVTPAETTNQASTQPIRAP